MEEKKKSPYNMWQNTGFMLSAAWRSCPSVIFLCVALAVVTAAQTVAELLIAPAVIARVEEAAPLKSLLLTIAGFSLLLLLLSGLKRYLDTNTLFGRVHIRMKLARSIGLKVSQTSYPNLMDAKFSDMESKAIDACGDNEEATEQIWTTWTAILTNLLGFAVYLAILSGLHPLLFCVIAVTAAVGYFVDKKVSGWGYRHREEAAKPIKEMGYIRQTATGRPHAKDIRMFGLGPWMNDVWRKSMSLFRAFLRWRESVYLWINLTDLLLTLIRNGVAYAYLLWLTLTTGMRDRKSVV